MHALCFCGGHLPSDHFLSIFLCPEVSPLYHCSDLLPATHQWGRRWPSGDVTTAWVSGPQGTGREACSVLTSQGLAEWPEELLQWPQKTPDAPQLISPSHPPSLARPQTQRYRKLLNSESSRSRWLLELNIRGSGAFRIINKKYPGKV